MSKQQPKPKTKLTETLERFQQAVDNAGGVNAAAHQLGCSPATVSLIYNDKRHLSDVELAFKIQSLWGIPMEDWVEVSEPKTYQRFSR